MAVKTRAVEHLEGTFKGYNGIELYTQSWRDKENTRRGIFVILHGLKDHSGRYTELARLLVSRGFAVHAYDMRGHGRSPGERAFIGDFQELISDLQIFIKDLRRNNPDAPVFIFGHSMGGTAVTLSVIDRAIESQGVILSAAALIPGESISPLLIRITRFLGNTSPHLPLMNLPNENFSRDPAVVSAMSADPFILQKNAPVRTAAELLNAMKQVQLKQADFNAPVLILHGTGDKLTNPNGSVKLSELAGVKDKTLKLYPDLYHDLVHEPEKDEVTADIADWVEARSHIRV